MKKLKLGLVGLGHPNFPGNQTGLFKKSVEGIKSLSKKLDFDVYIVDKLLYSGKDAKEAKKELESQDIDFLLVLNCAFASGEIITILARIDAYIGLWSLPEPTKDKALPINSFCGMNMNASIISEYLQHYDIPVKWFFGNVDDELFIKRFEITIRALTSIINLKNSTIGLIGGIVPGFDNQYYDERKLEKRFGIKVNRHLEFDDVKNKALSYKQSELIPTMEQFNKEYSSMSNLAKENLEKNARLYKAFVDIKNEHSLSGLAVGCWPKFRLELDMVPCAAIGRLNNNGIITACEGDVYGLVTMMTMRYLSQSPTLLLDLSSIDESDNTALMWHCGIGANKLAYNEDVKLVNHSNPANMPGRGKTLAAPVADMIFDKYKATIARFTREGEGLFLLSGKFKDPNKPSFDGTRGWLFDLELNGDKILARDLMNTIMVQKMQHHYAFAKGNLTNEMLEIAAWLDIKPLEKVKYKDYLQR